MPPTNAAPGVTVTTRVLGILGSFDAEHRSLTLSEIAERAGLKLPTAHRLVGELAGWGALRRTSSGRYVIGRRPLARQGMKMRSYLRSQDGDPVLRPGSPR